jgi:hypothetical protein
MSQLLEDQFIFSKNLAKLLNYLSENCYKWTMGEAYRTKEQAEIYAKTGKGIINSQHCKRLAQDIFLFKKSIQGTWNLIDDKEFYKEAGNYWESINVRNKWGGNFTTRNDPYHFEMSGD